MTTMTELPSGGRRRAPDAEAPEEKPEKGKGRKKRATG